MPNPAKAVAPSNTRRGNAGHAQTLPEQQAALAEPFVPPIDFDARQAAMGNRRKPAGPQSSAEGEAMPAPPPDVDETECAEPPEK